MKKLQTFAGWKAKIKKFYNNLETITLELVFEGDKDICQAFAKLPEDRACIGEWDGAEGEVYTDTKTKIEESHPYDKKVSLEVVRKSLNNYWFHNVGGPYAYDFPGWMKKFFPQYSKE